MGHAAPSRGLAREVLRGTSQTEMPPTGGRVLAFPGRDRGRADGLRIALGFPACEMGWPSWPRRLLVRRGPRREAPGGDRTGRRHRAAGRAGGCGKPSQTSRCVAVSGAAILALPRLAVQRPEAAPAPPRRAPSTRAGGLRPQRPGPAAATALPKRLPDVAAAAREPDSSCWENKAQCILGREGRPRQEPGTAGVSFFLSHGLPQGSRAPTWP